MYIFYNDHIIDDTTLKISYDNRALMYGDGLFETIIYQNDQIQFEQFHKERLIAGMQAMNLVFSKRSTVESVFFGIYELIKKSGYKIARIRLQVWRVSGGLYSPQNNHSHVMISCAPYKAHSGLSRETASFSKTVMLMESKWSAFKTISAMQYVQAGIEKMQRNLDELILLDRYENISECTSSNIFWKKENIYYTPSLKTGCIDGIMRRHIIDRLNEREVELQIGEYSKTKLLEAEEVFSCNVTGVHFISSIDDRRYTNTANTTQLLELL